MLENYKELKTKYLNISTFKEEYFNSFRMFKHENRPFFSRYSKVLEITFKGRTIVFEF
jgi:hypothetical protein